MASLSIKLENMLQGSSNFTSWKTRVVNAFVEFDLEDIVTREVEEPTSNVGRTTFRKKQAKAKRIIYDSIKDSMMHVLQSLATAKECMDALPNLYETKAPTQKRSLKKQLHTIKMEKNESIASFSRISQIKDQLLSIGAQINEDDFVGATIDDLLDSWSTFVSFVCGRAETPSFERFWHDFLEEENKLWIL